MTTAGYPLSGAVLCATLLLMTGCGSSQDDGAEAAPPSTPPASTAPADPPSSPPSPPSTDTTPIVDDLPKPKREQATATLKYLAGEGAPLMRIHRMAVGFRPTATQDECRQLGAQLDKIGTPDQLTPLIYTIADEPLQDIFNAEISALGGSVTDCAAGRTPSLPGNLSLPDLTKLVEQRLRDLRAAR